MGMTRHSNCSCNCNNHNYDERLRRLEKLADLPNPDPKNFKITRYDSLGSYLVAFINYPDCTNYEGNKILVFEGTDGEQLQQMSFIDPHFCDGKHQSPIARFEPTDRGWLMACQFIRMMYNG